MYKYSDNQILLPHEFFLPFGGKLNPENRWCKLAAMIPWHRIEEKYAKNFKNLRRGQVANSGRIALGSLIIQSQKSPSDRYGPGNHGKRVSSILHRPVWFCGQGTV